MSKIWIAVNTSPLGETVYKGSRCFYYVDVSIPNNDINLISAIKNFDGFCLSISQFTKIFHTKECLSERYFFPILNLERVEPMARLIKEFFLDYNVEIIETINPDPRTYDAIKLINEAIA